MKPPLVITQLIFLAAIISQRLAEALICYKGNNEKKCPASKDSCMMLVNYLVSTESRDTRCLKLPSPALMRGNIFTHSGVEYSFFKTDTKITFFCQSDLCNKLDPEKWQTLGELACKTSSTHCPIVDRLPTTAVSAQTKTARPATWQASPVVPTSTTSAVSPQLEEHTTAPSGQGEEMPGSGEIVTPASAEESGSTTIQNFEEFEILVSDNSPEETRYSTQTAENTHTAERKINQKRQDTINDQQRNNTGYETLGAVGNDGHLRLAISTILLIKFLVLIH